MVGPWLDGQLGECHWLEEHISGCPECLAEYEAIQRIGHLTSKSDFAPPEGIYWRGFVTRVSARIAACQVPRKRNGLFGSRIAAGFIFRIGAPLALAAIGLVVWQFQREKQLREMPQSAMQVPVNLAVGMPANEVEIRNSLPEEVKVSEPAKVLPEPSNRPLNESLLTNLESEREPSGGAPVESNEGEIQAPFNASDALGSAAFRRLQVLSRQPDYQPGRFFISEMAGGMRLIDPRLLSFDTKQILKFQMFAGSNSSLAPISMYNEAAQRFFAPIRSNSRVTFRSDTSGRWGYGFGDDALDQERLLHLKLELELLQEK